MNSPANTPTFIIKTLGCKVNQYEGQAMRVSLAGAGFTEHGNGEFADFYIINSCTVTSKADKETRNLIRHFHRINPEGKIVVAGCYAELDSDRSILKSILGVTHLIRNSEKEKVVEILDSAISYQPSAFNDGITSFKDRNRAFLKIQDGCNHRCSYCKVSLVRGPSRSRYAEEILKEAKSLVGGGFKEVVLTGVCLGAWGRDITVVRPRRSDKFDLANLIKEISQIDGLFRIRLSSIEPIYVTDRIINILRYNDKVCKHLHIPLQSGDDRILKAMQRPYTTKRFWQLIKKIRKQIPDAAITTDVLVGFPGEDDKRFRNTLKFIEHIKPSRIHVFSYSKRAGTQAAGFKCDVDKDEIKNRVKILTDLGDRLSMNFAKRFINKKQNAIIESHRDKENTLLTGYTDRYIRVFVDGQDPLKNRLIPVKIIEADERKKMVFARPGSV